MLRRLFLLIPFGTIFITSCVKERPTQNATTVSEDHIKASQFFNKLGLAAMVEENYAKAIANFSRAVQVNPYDPELWKNLGEAYTAAKFYKKAKEAFFKALALKPDYGEVYYDLGVLYTQWGKLKEAEKWFKKAGELDTYDERYKAFFALAHLYKMQGKEKKYLISIQKAINLYPKYKEALLELANYYQRKKQYKLAEKYYIQYLSAYPNDEIITLKYISLLIEEGKYTPAKKILRNLINTSQNPQIVEKAYKLVNEILLKEAQEKLKKKKKRY